MLSREQIVSAMPCALDKVDLPGMQVTRGKVGRRIDGDIEEARLGEKAEGIGVVGCRDSGDGDGGAELLQALEVGVDRVAV